MPRTTPVSVRIPVELKKHLDNKARLQNKNTAGLIREILNDSQIEGILKQAKDDLNSLEERAKNINELISGHNKTIQEYTNKYTEISTQLNGAADEFRQNVQNVTAEIRHERGYTWLIGAVCAVGLAALLALGIWLTGLSVADSIADKSAERVYSLLKQAQSTSTAPKKATEQKPGNNRNR
ncbi:hypothetical protein ONZ27_005592 [Salmonella enterica subsp. enterica serovar Chandans]|nr:hypothetical protein [Salmonella enterica subsp. enterica serovar Chandans]